MIVDFKTRRVLFSIAMAVMQGAEFPYTPIRKITVRFYFVRQNSVEPPTTPL